MMIKLSLLILSLIASATISAGEPVYCKGKGYSGYIFDSSHFVFRTIKLQKSRYTPTADDIEKAEKLLKEKLKQANSNRINQTDDCPVIDKKLRKYCRQYVGFVNTQGQKVIWINLFWNKRLEEQAAKDILSVQDGCSYYWNVEVNIDTGELKNLQINGSA